MMNLNMILLHKMGWKSTFETMSGEIDLSFWLINEYKKTGEYSKILAQFHDETGFSYCITAFFENEKQYKKGVYNRYEFRKVKIVNDQVKILYKKEVKCTTDILSLIKENLSCNTEYKRLFQINSIIK
jgi:hypothetical protein